MAMRILFVLLILIALTACLPFDYAPNPSSAEPLSIIHTPALAWMQDNLNLCAAANPKIALKLQEVPVTSLDLGAADAILKLGPAPKELLNDAHATLLGWEQIVIISSLDISPTQLELPDLQILYTSLEPTYQTWIYPPDSELSAIFNNHILGNQSVSPHVFIAPDPQAMLEVVSTQPNTVGFLPQSRLDDQTVNIIREGYPEVLSQPVLAITNHEPAGLVAEYLKCLEELLP